MAEPVNLNRFRKQKARAERKARADENAAKYGRTKAEKSLDAARRDKSLRDLDAHRSSDDDTDA